MNQEITTVIPTYKRPRLLRRAIMSALRQTYPYLRVLVCDNASGDGTAEAVAKIRAEDKRVEYHCQPENIGLYGNFNYGIAAVQTPFFSLLSDDDALAPDFYERVAEAFGTYPEAGLVCVSVVMIDINNNVCSDFAKVDQPTFYKAGEAFEGLVKGKIPGTWTGIVFKKEVKEVIGLINWAAGQFTDALYVYHAACRFPVIALPGIAAALMTHPQTNSAKIEPPSKNWVAWLKEMRRDITTDTAIPESIQSKAKTLIKFNFTRISFGRLLNGLNQRQWDYVDQVIEGLAECGYPVLGQIFKLFAGCYKYLPPVRWLTENLRQIKKATNQKKLQELDKKYHHYVEFMTELNHLCQLNDGKQ